MTEITGKRLLSKLAACPSDVYPQGVSEDHSGNLLIDGKVFDASEKYIVSHNVRDRDAESVDTIDSDWSVSIS